MANSSFEIKIERDSSGLVSLTGLSLEAANSLTHFLTALQNILKSDPSYSNFKIKLSEGSACVSVEADEAQEQAFDDFKSELINVTENRSSNPVFVDNLNSIRKIISKNGLTYQANIYSSRETKNLTNTFKSKRRYIKSDDQPTDKFHIEFYKGRLLEIGGLKPNFHIISETEGTLPPIDCTDVQGLKLKKFLFSNNQLFISVWVKRSRNGNNKFSLCDIYLKEPLFLDYKEFINESYPLSGTDSLKKIHYKLGRLFTENKFGNAAKFIRLFANREIDINYLRTVLVASKEFQHHDKIKSVFKQLLSEMEAKTKSVVS